MWRHLSLLCLVLMSVCLSEGYKKQDRTKCPKVKYMRHFDMHQMAGDWYVIQYYATAEESASYKCMRAVFATEDMDRIHMNFTYVYEDDPDNEKLVGNITWVVPDPAVPAHWQHSELPYEGVYNTYVVDTDYTGWSLLLHCAEKSKSPRYLTALLMSRTDSLKPNVIAFLRDKLPRYEIDLEYMFPMDQKHCANRSGDLHYQTGTGASKNKASKKHPLKPKHHRQRRDKAKNISSKEKINSTS